MNSRPPDNKQYQLSARLLARKGGAEPLQAKDGGLVLSRGAETPEDEILAQAIVDSTFNLLTSQSKSRNPPKAPAALTDLFDPTLVGGMSTRR